MTKKFRIFFIFSFIFFKSNTSFAENLPLPSDETKGTVLFLSDIHVNTEDSESNQILKTALTEYKDLNIELTAIISAGDNSDIGALFQDDFFNNYINKYFGETDILLAITRGNHDLLIYDDSYRFTDSGEKFKPTEQFLLKEFISGINPYVNKALPPNKSISDPQLGLLTPYYYQTDQAAHYIVLDNFTPTMHMMDAAQINWLDMTLSSISGDGRPIFIILHLPLNNTTPHSDSRFDLSDNVSAALEGVIKKYSADNIFVLSGHHHIGFGTNTTGPISADNSYNILIAPTLGKKNKAGYPEGSGYYIFISENSLTFCARDFKNKRWLREYDFSITLKPPTKTTLKSLNISAPDSEAFSPAENRVVLDVDIFFADNNPYTLITSVYSSAGKLIGIDFKEVSKANPISIPKTLPENTGKIKIHLWDNLSNQQAVSDSLHGQIFDFI